MPNKHQRPPKPTEIEESRLRMGQVRRKTAKELKRDCEESMERARYLLRPIIRD